MPNLQVRLLLGTVIVVAHPLALAEAISLALVPPAVVQNRLEQGLVKAAARQGAIRSLFADAGCAAEEQPVEKKAANVICRMPGETDSTIVVGGHFDFADEGKGIIDDWSGSSLLPSLYQALKDRAHHHTYLFSAFAAEEVGLHGSSRFVKTLTADQKKNVRAFVNLECLGVGPVNIWLSRADKQLAARAVEVARSLKEEIRAVNVDQVGDDDSHPFVDAHLPVITFHSLTQETIRLIHSSKDRVDAIHPDEYYNAYKLAAFYLEYLDSELD